MRIIGENCICEYVVVGVTMNYEIYMILRLQGQIMLKILVYLSTVPLGCGGATIFPKLGLKVCKISSGIDRSGLIGKPKC